MLASPFIFTQKQSKDLPRIILVFPMMILERDYLRVFFVAIKMISVRQIHMPHNSYACTPGLNWELLLLEAV